MNAKEAAGILNGNQYREEGSKELFQTMKENRLVAVFGGSDDLMEFRGAINDEVGAWDGTEVWITREGRIQEEFLNATGDEIKALWCEEDGFSWTYLTDISHETFLIMEDDETYCRGIVFSLDHLSKATS